MKNRGFEVVIDEKRKTVGEVVLPTRGSNKAMAYDFYATNDLAAAPNAIVKIWTDVKAYMNDNECLIINGEYIYNEREDNVHADCRNSSTHTED